MGITIYSVVFSALFYNLSLLAVYLLRRSGVAWASHASSLFMVLTVLGVVRLLSPVDLDAAYVIRSYSLLPIVKRVLAYPLAGYIRVGTILLLAWAGGSVVWTARLLREWRRDKRMLAAYETVEREDVLEIAAEFNGRFSLFVTPDTRTPFETGLFRPTIYVPDIELSEEEWRMVFRHELQHIRSLDELKKLFFLASEALFWWNPLAHISRDEIKTLLELRCDAKVTAKMSEGEITGYMETMKKIMAYMNQERSPALAQTLVEKNEEMKPRFAALNTKEAPKSRSIRRLITAGVIAVFIASYFVIVQPAYRYPGEEILVFEEGHSAYDNTQDIKDAETMYIVDVDGEYQLFVNGEFFGSLDEEALTDPQFSSIPYINAPILGGK